MAIRDYAALPFTQHPEDGCWLDANGTPVWAAGYPKEFDAEVVNAANNFDEMLEALKAVAASSMRNAAYDACIAALAKATGQS